MKLAMGALAVLAIVGGVVQIPKVTDALHTFLEPAFHDSQKFATLEPSGTLTWIGLLIGVVIALAGIFTAFTLWVRRPEVPGRLLARFPAVHRFFFNKWYFDEAIDFLVTRPWAWGGRFARDTFERLFVNGALVGGASGIVRAASAGVRAVQSGYLRYYAALLLVGLTGLGAYFLISA
jgi:NADH-quinone oxidoreductase subunit L